MRATKTHKTTLLVTADPALESAARDVAKELGDDLQLIHGSREATGTAFDSSARETFAIVDVEAPFGSRCMINTMAGLVPVIAVTEKPRPWLRSMLRHRRIHAQLPKPVSPEVLKKAVFQVRDLYGNDVPFAR